MNIKHAEYTSRGLVREQNEDAFLSCVGEDAALFLVADGIGGREGGEVASGMLQDGFRDWWDVFDAKRPRPDPGETAMEVRRRIMEINQAIQDKMGAQGSGSCCFSIRGSPCWPPRGTAGSIGRGDCFPGSR